MPPAPRTTLLWHNMPEWLGDDRIDDGQLDTQLLRLGVIRIRINQFGVEVEVVIGDRARAGGVAASVGRKRRMRIRGVAGGGGGGGSGGGGQQEGADHGDTR
ncbi:hypothetical protein HanIR_Chr04g0180201 [Helianthus annuus]|nr:hypothetical protein HanIR_Chr04g0180201 [Helianthus annuus]